MKPHKPFPTFPLTPHHRGGWAKKYKGHQLYIAAHEPDAAMAEFHRKVRAIDEGRKPTKPPVVGGRTVGEIVTRYMNEREADRQQGQITRGTFDDYRVAGVEMAKEFGRDRLVEDLTPDDFTRLYRRWANTLGFHALARHIQNCRTIWNHAAHNQWITQPPAYGSVFRKPTTGRKQGESLTVAEVRKVLAVSTGQMRAMILLCINCGFTGNDCAKLPPKAVDLTAALVRFPRPKMSRRNPVDRAAPLWPETVSALRPYIKPEADLVFRTMHGNPWVRDGTSRKGKDGHVDSFSLMFRRLCVVAGVKPRGPSWLRHLFCTIADEMEKPHATARIMGHRLPGQTETYVDRIEHDRLQEVTEYVRCKVLPDPDSPPENYPDACLI